MMTHYDYQTPDLPRIDSTARIPGRDPGPVPLALSDNEWTALLRVIHSVRDRTLIVVARSHGLRPAEVGRLRSWDIDLRHRTVRLRGRPVALVPLLKIECRALRQWLPLRPPGCTALFPSRNRHPISRRRLDALMKQYGREAGIPRAKAHFGILRATCGIELAREADESLICEWLGLRDVRSASVYLGNCRLRGEHA